VRASAGDSGGRRRSRRTPPAHRRPSMRRCFRGRWAALAPRRCWLAAACLCPPPTSAGCAAQRWQRWQRWQCWQSWQRPSLRSPPPYPARSGTCGGTTRWRGATRLSRCATCGVRRSAGCGGHRARPPPGPPPRARAQPRRRRGWRGCKRRRTSANLAKCRCRGRRGGGGVGARCKDGRWRRSRASSPRRRAPDSSLGWPQPPGLLTIRCRICFILKPRNMGGRGRCKKQLNEEGDDVQRSSARSPSRFVRRSSGCPG